MASGLVFIGKLVGLAESKDKEGKVLHHVAVFCREPSGKVKSYNIKTQRPAYWAKMPEGQEVQIPVSIFTPSDSSAIFLSEVI